MLEKSIVKKLKGEKIINFLKNFFKENKDNAYDLFTKNCQHFANDFMEYASKCRDDDEITILPLLVKIVLAVLVIAIISQVLTTPW